MNYKFKTLVQIRYEGSSGIRVGNITKRKKVNRMHFLTKLVVNINF